MRKRQKNGEGRELGGTEDRGVRVRERVGESEGESEGAREPEEREREKETDR